MTYPLLEATKKGDFDKVKEVLKSGKDINIQSVKDASLMIAARSGYLEIVECLIKAGANINVKNRNKETALMWAASGGHLDVLMCLIEAKADVSAIDQCGHTALNHANKNGHQEVVQYLKRFSSDSIRKNSKINENSTSARLPQKEDQPSSSKSIAVKSKNDHKSSDDMTLFWTSVEHEWNQLPSDVRKRESGPLLDALTQSVVFIGDIETLRFVINERKKDVNAITDRFANTLLMVAALRGHTEIVRFLIEEKANVNAANQDGQTALIVAAFKGHLEIAKCLIEAKANINVQNKKGYTALTYATRNGHLGVEEYLKIYIQKEMRKKYTCIGGAMGFVTGMTIAYYAGTAIAALAIVGLLLGVLVGYVVTGVKKEKDGDPNIGVVTALKNVFFTEVFIGGKKV